MLVDRGAAHQALVQLEVAEPVEHLRGRRQDLGPDTVAGKGDDVRGHGGRARYRLAAQPAPSTAPTVSGVNASVPLTSVSPLKPWERA